MKKEKNLLLKKKPEDLIFERNDFTKIGVYKGSNARSKLVFFYV